MIIRVLKMCGCSVILLSMCILFSSVSVDAESKYYDWKKIEDNLWRRQEKNSIYARQELTIYGDSLLSPHYYTEEYGGKWGEGIVTSWKIDKSYQSLQIVAAKKNLVYVQLSSEADKSLLYVVNLDTLKKR